MPLPLAQEATRDSRTFSARLTGAQVSFLQAGRMSVDSRRGEPLSSKLVISFGAVLLLLAGCNGSQAVTKTISFSQYPESETLTCYTFKLDNDVPLEIGHVKLDFGQGSHHVHVYRADSPQPDNVDGCPNGIDWNTWHMLVGAQTHPVDWTFPEGVTLPLQPHEQLLVQVHWLNTTSTPQNYDINLRFDPVSRSDQHLGVVFGVNKDVVMPPYTSKTAEMWCPLPGANLLAIMGHYHARGTHYTVRQERQDETSGPVIYSALGEQTLEFQVSQPALPVATGDGLDFRCDYFNNNDFTITWGPNTATQEHCNMAAYYYPAAGSGSELCLSGTVPAVASIDPTPTRVTAGQPALLTVLLNEPVPTGTGGVDVTLVSSDSSVATVPAIVHIADGAQSANFQVTTLRPSRGVVISASAGGAQVEASVAVDGLVLSEFPRADPGSQWIQIQNMSAVSVDLSQYSLGFAGSSYAASVVPLTIVMPPAGCAVIGEWSNASQSVAFQPPMGWDAASTNGVALFDVPASAVTSLTTPLDAVVWGVNASGLLDSSGAPAAAQTVVPAGWAFRRQTLSQWVADPAPSPGICQVQ
jgi:hypothetical protein